MDPRILQSFFRIGLFIGGCGFVLIFLEPRDSPEFVLSICSTFIGLALMIGTVILLRVTQRRL